jgi:outer membrane receptor for monomeric catechols
MRKEIRLTIEPGGNIGEDSYVLDVQRGKEEKILSRIDKDHSLLFIGKKFDVCIEFNLKIKIRWPRARRPYIIFIEGDNKKKIKMPVKKNAHYKDKNNTEYLIVRRTDTDCKEFLLLISDDRYSSNLITH